MNVGSLFSGIGGLDKGLSDAGHQHVFFCENDPWRRSILHHHWPGVPIHDDVRDVGAGHPACDLLCGGFPCQDLSVAGKRAGLAGERSGLFHEFARIAGALRPGWLLVENVPGLLSSNGGRDFGILLGTLADIGYGVAWRTLDSRFFGVPQRRRRVFILAAHAHGDTRAASERAGQVLAVGTRCDRHLEASREAGQGAAWASADGADGSRVAGPPGTFTGGHKQDLDGNGAYVTVFQASGGGGGQMGGALAPALKPQAGSGYPMPAVAFAENQRGELHEADIATAFHMTQDPVSGHISPAMGKGNRQGTSTIAVRNGHAVRRLTPIECERLQALPDNWTNPDGTAPDSRRYAALGDAVTASVGHWLGHRLKEAS